MERKDWVWASVGDIATISSGNTPKGINDIEFNPEYKIPFYKISDMNTEGNEGLVSSSNIVVSNDLVKKLKLRLEPGGTIIFPKRGGAILTNKKRRLSKESAYDLNIMGVKEKNKSIFNDYLWYWFVKLDLAKLYDGSNVPQINNKDIEPLAFPIAPLPEQRAIVAKIEQLFSELDNGIDNLTKAQKQLKVYRQAVLKKAYEGELTKAWRAKQTDLPTAEELLEQIKKEREAHYQLQVEAWKSEVEEWELNGKEGKKPVKPKFIKIFNEAEKELDLSIPFCWAKICLGNLSSGVEYGTSAKSDDTGLIPVIRMGNMQGGKIDWKDLKYTDDQEEIKQYILREGDVLFNRTNSPELVGKAVYYRGERPALFAGYLIRINHIPKVVNGEYINYFLNSHPAKVYGSFVKTDGVNQSNINGQKLSNYPFPICSLQEQSQIVQEIESRLSVCDKVEETIKESLEKAEALRQSILKKAFEGKLLMEAELEACRSEPDWETAEKLLERIKAEKGKAGKAKKKEVLA